MLHFIYISNLHVDTCIMLRQIHKHIPMKSRYMYKIRLTHVNMNAPTTVCSECLSVNSEHHSNMLLQTHDMCMISKYYSQQYVGGAYWSRGQDVDFRIQRSMVQTPAASVCCAFEQDT